MLYRSLASLLVISTILSTQVRSEEAHEKWAKYLSGTWNWKSSDGNHGTVVFEPFSNTGAKTVKERCENLDASTLMTQGWRPDKKAFGGAGYDSDGNYVETYFTQLTDTTMTGQRLRRSASSETKEQWEVTRKTEDRYEITVTIEGNAATVVVTRK